MDLPGIGTRSSASTITFAHPFRLGQDPRELPAGTYAVHTEQAIYQGAFGPVAVATSVDLLVEKGASRSTRVIRSADLRAALARDVARHGPRDETSENPDRGRATECRS